MSPEGLLLCQCFRRVVIIERMSLQTSNDYWCTHQFGIDSDGSTIAMKRYRNDQHVSSDLSCFFYRLISQQHMRYLWICCIVQYTGVRWIRLYVVKAITLNSLTITHWGGVVLSKIVRSRLVGGAFGILTTQEWYAVYALLYGGG
jgi:hypothetical protein